MLDMYGTIMLLRQPQVRHFDAALNLLYHTSARPIGLWLSKQHHSTVVAGFCVSSEDDMIKQCPVCGEDFKVKPSHADKRVYCSMQCRGEAYKIRMSGENNPNYSHAGRHTCPTCGREFVDYNKSRKYCSVVCRARSAEHMERFWAFQPKSAEARQGKGKYRQRTLGLCILNQKKHVCPVCDKLFYAYQDRTTCSKACRNKLYSSKHFSFACVVCGKSISAPPSAVKHKNLATCSRECSSIRRMTTQLGDKSHRWRGGRTSQVLIIRNSLPYKQWRSEVFKRDDYTCQLCGARGGRLAAHHIREFAKTPELRLTVGNGLTLCWTCHGSIKGKETDYEGRFYAITGGIE